MKYRKAKPENIEISCVQGCGDFTGKGDCSRFSIVYLLIQF